MTVKTPIAMVSVLLAVLAFAATPALAAAPEAPETLKPNEPVAATTAFLNGVVNPKITVPVEAGEYEFLYKATATATKAECESVGASRAPAGAYLGAIPEPVAPQEVTGLTQGTEYVVCLAATNTTNPPHTRTVGNPVPFTTALPPETPVTEAVTLNTTGTTATLNGELNPNVTAKDGYDFTYNTNGTCEPGTTSTPGTETTETERKVSTSVTELEGSTEYTFCVVEMNAAGETATGAPLKFKTPPAKPVILSETAPTVTPVGATLEATVNPERQETTYRLEYSTEEAKVEKGEGTSLIESALSGPGLSEAQIVGPVETGPVLTPSTTYYYRVVATNGTGTEDGKVEEFTTSAFVKPVVEGESVSAVGRTTATLSGVVNPEFQRVLTCEFAYVGMAPLSARCLPGATGLGIGGTGVGTGASLVGLEPNTEYHYKLLAKNKIGLEEGLEESFLTLPDPPAVSTGGASVTGPTTATIPGSVNPGASALGILNSQAIAQDDTTYYVEYGGSTGYGQRTATGDAGEGTSVKGETVSLAGLEPGRTYHYRLVASNLNDASELYGSVYGETLQPQVVYGADATFTTPATTPVISGVSVSGVTQNGATITGTLNPQNLPSRWELQLGATQGQLQPVDSGGAFSTTELSLPVSSLSPGRTYYYKLLVTGPDGTVESPEASFTTSSAPAGASPGLPALIPYQSIAVLDAKEAKEDKGLPGPTGSKSLTRAQKLSKALKACKKKSKGKRAACVRQARKQFGPIKRKK
jgi:hypothetical protein